MTKPTLCSCFWNIHEKEIHNTNDISQHLYMDRVWTFSESPIWGGLLMSKKKTNQDKWLIIKLTIL